MLKEWTRLRRLIIASLPYLSTTVQRYFCFGAISSTLSIRLAATSKVNNVPVHRYNNAKKYHVQIEVSPVSSEIPVSMATRYIQPYHCANVFKFRIFFPIRFHQFGEVCWPDEIENLSRQNVCSGLLQSEEERQTTALPVSFPWGKFNITVCTI